MITPFFRSSLLNSFSLCPLRCFLEYSIGLRGEANKSALIGSTVHGVLELLALGKLAYQQGKESFKHDSFFGNFNTNRIIDAGNIDSYIKISYDYYDKENPGLFGSDSYDECVKLSYRAIHHHNGAFDPRNSNICAAELPFEMDITDKWASYQYESPSGLIKGRLALKGTIDLVCIEDENTFHCIDYKTSKAANDWASGKTKVVQVKDPEKETSLYNDQQLMLYYYVLANKFPDKDIIMTLYFIRIDKAFTVVFDRKKDLPRIHAWLRERFEYIKSVEKPDWIDGTKDGWKCRFCPHNKNKQVGSKLSVCKFYQKQFASQTMKEIMDLHADFSTISSYGSGGSTANRE